MEEKEEEKEEKEEEKEQNEEEEEEEEEEEIEKEQEQETTETENNQAHTNYLLSILGDTSEDPLGISPLPHTQIQSLKDDIIHLRTRLAEQEK